MMAAIPSLSSLPGADRTIYLDFDGDFQSEWNRTDSNQVYRDVSAKPFNIDNTEGISNAEASAIRKIWETAADDFSPFNVNVTTVPPASFSDDTDVRVVIAGHTSATLETGNGNTFNVSGNVFISDDQGNPLDTSGYASVGSFTDDEPNVVYVFAKHMKTWSMTEDDEGHPRDLRAIVATTISHETGHAFGLEHHGDYDLGTSITTPIMGNNVQGDRSIWSSYTVDGESHDNIAALTELLGTRPDDYASSYRGAANLPLRYHRFLGVSGSISGVIGSTQDTDAFRFQVGSTATFSFTVNGPQFGNLDAKLTLYRVIPLSFFGTYYQTIATADHPIYENRPFAGLAASFSRTLRSGTYMLRVGSHGGYGDVGGYTLAMRQSRYVIYVVAYAPTSLQTTTQTNTSTTSVSSRTSLLTSRISAGAGQSSPSTSSRRAQSAAVINPKTEADQNAKVDDVFATWSDLETQLITGVRKLIGAKHSTRAS